MLVVPACRARAPQPAASGSAGHALDAAARSYVTWSLALNEILTDHPDAALEGGAVYTGPASWQHDADVTPTSVAGIATQAAALADRLADPSADDPEGVDRSRRRALLGEVRALAARAGAAASGRQDPFDDEVRTRLGMTPPVFPAKAELEARHRLEALLPGSGSLASRYVAAERSTLIPPSRLGAVMTAALEACRDRTLAHLHLPPGEHVRLEYVTGEPWNAEARYEGRDRSLIRIDMDHPITIDRALDLACHEGYPGHHVFDVLADERLVQDKGWQEFSFHPIASPGAFVEESVASFATDVAFPGAERLAFERDVLFPLAGLSPRRAARADRIRQAVDGLAPVTSTIARAYLDGGLDRPAASRALEERAAMPDPQAMLRFIDRYRSYVIAYTMGKDLVRRYVESRGGTPDDPDRRWQVYAGLLGHPILPNDLVARK